MKKKRILLIIACFLMMQNIHAVWAAEPHLSNYTDPPIFMSNVVAPNIMIMLDNSGSMNFNAYGTWPGNGGPVTDAPFTGKPYDTNLTFTRLVQSVKDDAEEWTSTGESYYDSGDLDLGRVSSTNPSIVGIRFQNIGIPKGSTIISAQIEFKVSAVKVAPTDGNISLEISGEDADNPDPYSGLLSAPSMNDISSRPRTYASVTWSSSTSPSTEPWNPLNSPQFTTDIKSIVQEIMDRPGWNSGNAMAFMIDYKTGLGSQNKRDAKAYNATSPTEAPLLRIVYTTDELQRYYGYFNPEWFYEYSGNAFVHKYKKADYDTAMCSGAWQVRYPADYANPDPDEVNWNDKCLTDADLASEGLWDGNWMNWATMRRIDVARKVMVGGLATSRMGTGTQILHGETPAQSERTFYRNFDSTGNPAVNPYHGNYYYGMKDGYIYIDDDVDVFSGELKRLPLAVKKDDNFEPEDFYLGNVSGILQRVYGRANWGNVFFYTGSGRNLEGGYIDNPIGTNDETLITDLQNTSADTYTPLAEAYYVTTQYFKQEKPQSNLGYSNNAVGAINNTNDPYYNGKEFVPCAKSFVLMITDGASTEDLNIPDTLKNYDGDNTEDSTHVDYRNYIDNGSDYLDDIALYAKTNDLRADLDGDQNIILYPIYAFGEEISARNLLMDAARNGGFVDKNGNNLPDGDYSDPDEARMEWDENKDRIPDTYFEAKDGYALEAQLIEAINDILRRSASGTAVSVLATSSEGEGNLVQAYFKPVVMTTGLEETRWAGYLQSLWVDSKGNLREDTKDPVTKQQDLKLDIAHDKVVTYFVDANGDAKVQKWAVDATNPYPDFENDTPDIMYMEDIESLWEAGSLLAARNLDIFPRKIFTYIEGGPTAYYGGIMFDTTEASILKPYLGVKDDNTWDYLGETHDERTANLINFVQGFDAGSYRISESSTNMRTRFVEGYTWKLGDIVNSTPMAIAYPPERFDIIYSDYSYHEFYDYHRNRTDRETVVFVGANDGMLHAFTAWQYDSKNQEFVPASGTTDGIGQELWAYIPQALLPHLKWLPHPDYNHVSYVDLPPKVTNAKIFFDGTGNPIDTTYHKNGWGTILIGGLRMGGKSIPVTDDFDNDSVTPDTTKTFTSSYFAIDVSNPRDPKLLWEKTFNGLGLTTSDPTVIKVGDKWFCVIGSGPETYGGESNQFAHLYVLDLATGTPYQSGGNDWLFETPRDKAFIGASAGIDKLLNYNVDGLYFSETYDDGGWKGGVYKVTIPWQCTAADCTGVYYGDTDKGAYVDNPTDALNPWRLSLLFAANAPVTAPPSLSVDKFSNAWVYFGTGRYLSQSDKIDTDTQYLFGIKDPFFNSSLNTAPDDFYLNNSKNLPLTSVDLFDADKYKLTYAWGYVEAPAGDCSLVEVGQVGDIYATGDIGDTYSPGSCICEYDWPLVTCTELTTDHCAAVNPSGDIFNDGDCVCVPYEEPQWGCIENVAGDCDGVGEGRVGDIYSDGSCVCMYWETSGATDSSCLGVPFGTVGTGLGDGTCDAWKVAPPVRSCFERPPGMCPPVNLDPYFNPGVEGDYFGDGGSCYSGYWACTETVEGSGACDTVDYTLQTGMFGPNGDGDYFAGDGDPSNDGSCICEFVDEPKAVVTSPTGIVGESFNDLLDLARGYDGWQRILPDPGERSITQPAVLGGAALFTSFVPSPEICAFGGKSYLWALYYETGTAYKKPIIGTEIVDGVEVISERITLGIGKASGVAVHIGDQGEKKATSFIQLSTGAVVGGIVDTPGKIRSGLISWREND